MSELFNIRHETGDLSEYDSTVTDSGDLSVTQAAALAGTGYGLQCLIDDTNAIYGVVNQTPPVSGEIRVRFYLDPNSLTMADTDVFAICTIAASGAVTNVVRAMLRYTTADGYSIRAQALNDGGVEGYSTVEITGGPHYVELHVERASSDVAADGRVRFWVDGSLEKTWSDVDNFDLFANMLAVHLGAVALLDAGTSGTLYLDELCANDDGKRIGPVGLAARVDHQYRTRRL